jgi:hypothetical protein
MVKHSGNNEHLAAAEAKDVASETTQSVSPQAAATGAVESVTTEGVRARRAFMLKQLIPDQDWIMKNVVANGKGTRATIGRVWGIANGCTDKVNTLPDGSPSSSIVLQGAFNTESYITGELSEASNAYLPMAYAEKLKALFAADKSIQVIEVDCDVGIEATGKTIPYEWVITAFREGEEMAVLKRIRGARQKPKNLLVGSGGAVLQLTGPAK